MRLNLAKEFVLGSIHNMRKTLMQYNLKSEAEHIEQYKRRLSNLEDIQKIMLKEAESKEYYYKQLNKIVSNPEFLFVKRVRNPPDNFINTLISFGNSLLYTTVLSEIFKTQLNPTISYLHEPFERRYSLNLDIADIFKPLIIDRVIFSLINRKQINSDDFDKELNYCYLNEDGRRIFLKEYDKKLQTTIKYPGLNRKVSYKYMLRLECYKLIKYFLEKKPYKTFKIYW
jgi:CRISPR-associated protein Cas1